MRLAIPFACIASVSVASVVHAQQRDFSNVQVAATHVAGNVYMLTGSGGNIGLHIGDDGAFVIDDQFAPLTEKILAAIATVTAEPVKFVVNTHYHGDHTGGNENLGKAGALIVAHENVRMRMNPAEFSNIIGNSVQAPPGALPVVTFTQMLTFHWNGDDIHVFHVDPAHTDGDAVIHFSNANVYHMGDTFFNGRYPFIDVASGGDADGVIAVANRVLAHANADSKIIPGHGPLATPDDLQAYRDMLVGVRSAVESLVRQGMTADQVVAANPTAAFEGAFTGNSERFVRAMYQAVTSH